MQTDAISRRQALKRISRLSVGLCLTGGTILGSGGGQKVGAAENRAPFLIEGKGQSPDQGIEELTRKVFAAAGGMGRFVSKGDVVAIKPNISWSRLPHLGATTNPLVLAAVITLCQEVGAKKIRIADNTIHDAQRCFATSGAGLVAQKSGADLVYPRASLMRKIKINGHRLDIWPVFTPLVEADTLINLPIAKHHSLSRLTLGMKNWIGGVGGGRWSLHQDIHQSIVDLAQFFKPAITLIDATRIMTRNGPSGGSPEDVVAANRLILSNDPVAADAAGAALFGLSPEAVGHIRLGRKWGLGTWDATRIEARQVVL